MSPEYISITELAERWNMTHGGVYAKLQRGEIPGVKRAKNSSRWLVPASLAENPPAMKITATRKLTEPQRREIAIRRHAGEQTADLAKEFKISSKRVYQIADSYDSQGRRMVDVVMSQNGEI